jgi:hypothetical protein
MATNTSSPPKEYQYTDILQKNEIRVSHLQPGEPNDTIVIEISKEVLNDDTPPYHALSWEWGEGSHTKSIRAKDKDSTVAEIRTMNIRSNLYVALKHLRLQDKVRRLWVDAICIYPIRSRFSCRRFWRPLVMGEAPSRCKAATQVGKNY